MRDIFQRKKVGTKIAFSFAWYCRISPNRNALRIGLKRVQTTEILNLRVSYIQKSKINLDVQYKSRSLKLNKVDKVSKVCAPHLIS
jgi:hypothetical protein